MPHSHSLIHAAGWIQRAATHDLPSGHDIAPREASPDSYASTQPNAWHRGGAPTDFGTVLNTTNKAQPYTHGLKGVDQSANFYLVHALLVSFFALLAITIAYKVIHMINAYLRLLFTMRKWEDQRYWMYNHSTWWPKVKKHLLYAPLGRQRHNREIVINRKYHIDMGTVPGRWNAILIVLYCAANLAYCLLLSFGRKNSHSVIAELRGRTGALAAINLIPTVLFALRNNPLIPLLRVSYDTFNLLHRWCARITILEAVVHTICWGVNSYHAGGAHEIHIALSTSVSYAGGMVGTVAFAAIFWQSWSPVRHAFYETFLAGHRLLVALALAGTWIHLDKANLPQYPYLQLVVAFWAIEVGFRTLRIIYLNFSRRKGITKVTIEALPSEACRVTFELSRPWTWRPGCHVHAYLPRYAFWSSHPFSVAWAENDSARSLEMLQETEAQKHGPTTVTGTISGNRQASQSIYARKGFSAISTVERANKPENANMVLPHDHTVTSISLVMRARSGMTRKLYDRARNTPTGSLTTWGAIEGPYGGHESLNSYGTLVLFAGGVGITHCIGYLHHLILQYQAGTSSTQKILLVWSVPNTEALEWVRKWMDQILRMEGRRDVLRIHLFVTKPRHRGEVVSATGSVQMFPGRCNPETILQREMQERIGAMGVTVCGPGAFADSVRNAARGLVTMGNVEFIEEAFTY